jgi:hypothetical protein
LLELVKRDLIQSLLVGSIEEDLGDDLCALRVVLVRIERFPPSKPVMSVSSSANFVSEVFSSSPADTKTPFAPSLHARDWTQVVALLCAEVQELLRDLGRYGMVAIVRGRHFAVSIAQEASHGLSRMQRQRLLEDVQTLAHCGGGAVVV